MSNNIKQLTELANNLAGEYSKASRDLNVNDKYIKAKEGIEQSRHEIDLAEAQCFNIESNKRFIKEKYDNAIQEIQDLMVKENLEEFNDFELKYSVKKEVSTSKFWGIVGDIDTVMSLAKISQTDLKKYAEEQKDNGTKKAIKGCIVEISKTVSGVSHANAVK